MFWSYKVLISFSLRPMILPPEYQTHGCKYISKIGIISFDKLPFLYNKLTVLIASILPSIILFNCEIDGKTN